MSNSKFFTNEPEKDLYTRFTKILQSNTQFFDILVGYFRTSGFFKLKDAMENVEKIRILVGLNVDNYTVKIIDSANDEISFERRTEKESKEIITDKLEREFADAPEEQNVEDGVRTFINWLKSGKLEMRMYTEAPLHAKVYIMRKDQVTADTIGSVITGSSNFSAAGLQNNLEFNVELRDDDDVQFAEEKFEELWEKGVDIRDTYIETVEDKTWLNNNITPYEIYLKTLYEFFKEEINSDKDKLAGVFTPESFMELRYQTDAVVQAKKILAEHNGVFISDVVGLGKTYICAMLAKSLKKGKKLIICPPVLVEYWKQTLEDFDVSAKVESLGKLDKLLEKGIDDYSYVFIDEAHRFRNDKTEGYSKLFEICFGKKVILISATPINNYSSDIQHLLYLFQPKHNSTIVGVKDLELFFSRLDRNLKKYKEGSPLYMAQLRANSEEIRDKILRHVLIRRTRGEIKQYYADDMEAQGLSFPTLGSPEQIVYEFDDETDAAFTETINKIKTFHYSRYQPLAYLKDKKKYASLIAGSMAVGGFMKATLVKRLESSFYAFRKTLHRFVESYERFIDMYDRGDVWISKKVNVYDLLDSGDINKLMQLYEDDDAMHFKSSEFTAKFMLDLMEDLSNLKYLQALWQGIDKDPKLDKFLDELRNDPKLQGNKKIIFTESRETAEYLDDKLTDVMGRRVISFSGASSDILKQRIESSFNPKYADSEDDQYDILITTDVLAEGINLHRANALVNYDLPWNPTRIMQRVGRINRVGTEFDEIYVYNFFPTAQSKKYISLESRILEKLQEFHDTLGEDYKYLSDEEVVTAQGLFERLNSNLEGEEESTNPELAYLAVIRKVRDEDVDLFDRIKNLPRKAKSGRESMLDVNAAITFIRKGGLKTFYLSDENETRRLSFIDAIKYIECGAGEKRLPVKKEYYQLIKRNDKAFDSSLVEDSIVTMDKPKPTGNEASVLKTLRAMKRIRTFTDEQDTIIVRLIKAYEEGNISKAYTNNIMKDLRNLKDSNDIVEAYYAFVNNIPDKLLTERQEIVIKHEGEKQVILSEYLNGGKDVQ